jgi:hypothetical protein
MPTKHAGHRRPSQRRAAHQAYEPIAGVERANAQYVAKECSGFPLTDQLDKAGQTILRLLRKAAGMAEAKNAACPRNGAEAFPYAQTS